MTNKNSAFFVLDYSITGGVERVISNLSNLFNHNNIEFNFLLSLTSKNKKPLISFPANLHVIVISNPARSALEEELYQVLINNNITTLLFQGDNMTTSLIVLKAASRAGCRAVLHYHGSPYGYLKKYIYVEDVLKRPFNAVKFLWSYIVFPFKKGKLKKVIINATGGFVCVSNGVKEELFHLYRLPANIKNRIIAIHNPLTFKKSIDPFLHKENNIVYVSRLYRQHKNAMMILKVWKLIEKDFPKWQLFILGDGPLKSSMEEFCRKENLAQVHFTGMVSNVQEYLQKSSVSVLTSDCEGLGMGLLESASYANALVVTKADGGVTDIVVEGETGCLVKRNDVNAFSRKLAMVMQNTEKRKLMGENAFKKLDNFSDEKIVSQWRHLLNL